MLDQSSYPNFQNNEVAPPDTRNYSLLKAGNITKEDSPTEAEKGDSSFDVPCLQGSSYERDTTPNPTNDLCGEPLEADEHFGLRFGHRMRTRNSMLGDFDGFLLDVGLGNFALSGIAGFPSVSGSDQINPKKQLFGFSGEIGKLANAWDLSGYMMEQLGNDQDRRRALGGAIRYSQTNRSLLMSADYDVLNRKLRRFMLSSAWKPVPNSTLSTTIGLQQGSLPTPQKKYLQQTMSLTEGWKWGLPLDRIQKLSADASTEVTSFGLSLSHAFARNIKLDSDIAILNVALDDTSNDLAGSLSDTNEFYFNLKVTGKDMLLTGDKSSVTLRHNAREASSLLSFLLDGSYPISRQWNFTPRLQIEYRDDQADGTVQWFVSPAVKVKYRLNKLSQINFNAADEWLKSQNSAGQEYHISYVVSLSYKTDF